MIFKLFIDRNKPEEVTATVHERTPLIDEIERLVMRDSLTDQIPGYKEDEIVMLSISRIECFVVEGEKTFAVYSDGKRYIVRKRLYELEEKLGTYYVRISKSMIVNLRKVRNVSAEPGGRMVAVLLNDERVIISRSYVKDIKRRLGIQ